MADSASNPHDLPLGRDTEYATSYDPSLLRGVPRVEGRHDLLPAGQALPFDGEDVWHCYEFSCLGLLGVPRMAVVRLRVPCDSPAIVESKSLKLYLNSFAQETAEMAGLVRLLARDIGGVVGCRIGVEVLGVDSLPQPERPAGMGLDGLRPDTIEYSRNAGLLRRTGRNAQDRVYTNLFRSICPVTGQPDWATVSIAYQGMQVGRRDLLAYLVSHRLSSGFHETAMEQVFVDVMDATQATRLTVHGRFLRRGGIDINPFRSLAGQQAETNLKRVPRQ